MTVAVVIVVVWLAALLLGLALCRAAALGDRQMDRRRPEASDGG